MNYKELIERLKRQGSVATYKEKTICSDCKDAAIAIETLLVERDAAISELKQVADCTSCKFYNEDAPERYSCNGFLSGWQWRGLQKESGEYGKA